MIGFARVIARAKFTAPVSALVTAPFKAKCIAKHTTLSWSNIFLLASLSACTAPVSKQLTFDNPPSHGHFLTKGQRYFACQTKNSARHMASTGFLIAGCEQLQPDNADHYRVNHIQKIDLPEGEMWQIQLIGPKGELWMALPWHDWA